MSRLTSIKSYWKIKEQGLLSKRRFEVYEALCEIGPSTAGEVFLSRKSGHTLVKGSICARLTELRDLGLVFEAGEKVCQLTKKSAIVWDVIDALPAKPLAAKKPSYKELEKQNAFLKERLAYYHKKTKQLIDHISSLQAKEVS